MCACVLSGLVTFDGKVVVVGGVKLFVERCEVEGVNFSFSPTFGLRLLKDETRGEAQNLLKELSKCSLLSDNTKSDLSRQVGSKGFNLVERELERYKQFIPMGEPKFYAEVCYDKQVDRRIISLVTAEKTLRFFVTVDMQVIVAQLPVNVYKSDIVHTGFSLNLKDYSWLLGKEKDFFIFVEELYRYSSYLRGNTGYTCYSRYFEDSVQAQELLGSIRSRVSGRESRDQLFKTLDRDKFLEFSEGLFVYNGWSTFYVSNNGDVRRLCYRKQVETREAILRAYVKGKLPTKLGEEKDPGTLKRIAEIVGKTRPDLTLLILP
ncbi:MAG: hypothetical protein FWF66_00030 [Candidatus Bathyarchaeota archaeon]|nr:hypothetical protein [Candidatus Termiticorpusculum sp.]